MRLGVVTIRLVTVVILLVSFSDYWAYDRWDPTAPMTSAGLDAIAAVDWHSAFGASVRSTNLPDDHCTFCSPLMAPPAPSVPQLGLDVQSVIDLPHAVLFATVYPLATLPFPPWRESTGFELPLRV